MVSCIGALSESYGSNSTGEKQTAQVIYIFPTIVQQLYTFETTGAFRQFLRKNLILSPTEGAQTTLICATQPGVVNGGYYHNTMGRIIHHIDDPAVNSINAEQFWKLLEDIVSNYLDMYNELKPAANNV